LEGGSRAVRGRFEGSSKAIRKGSQGWKWRPVGAAPGHVTSPGRHRQTAVVRTRLLCVAAAPNSDIRLSSADGGNGSPGTGGGGGRRGGRRVLADKCIRTLNRHGRGSPSRGQRSLRNARGSVHIGCRRRRRGELRHGLESGGSPPAAPRPPKLLSSRGGSSPPRPGPRNRGGSCRRRLRSRDSPRNVQVQGKAPLVLREARPKVITRAFRTRSLPPAPPSSSLLLLLLAAFPFPHGDRSRAHARHTHATRTPHAYPMLSAARIPRIISHSWPVQVLRLCECGHGGPERRCRQVFSELQWWVSRFALVLIPGAPEPRSPGVVD
jgi:hypothetical protein